MKRIISILTVILMLVSVCVFSTGTVFATEGDFAYKTVAGGVEITSFTADVTEKDENGDIVEKSLIIPESLGGLPVVGIGEKAFYQNKSRVNIIVPSSVEYMGNRAFAGSYITGINIPDSVKVLGSSAFNYCVYLEKLTLSSNIKTIPNSCFAFCTRLDTVTVPEGVEVIEDMAFQSSNHLSTVTLPSTLKSIGEYSFAYTGLTEVTIPEGTQELSNFSFFLNEKLEKVVISGTVKTIGENAFRSCYVLSTLTLGEGIETIKSSAFESCALTDVSIPASVTEIGDYAIGYTFDDAKWEYFLIEDFEILCVEGTAGYEYATANGIAHTATPAEPPTNEPTEAPSSAPTETPTNEPTEAPSSAPTETPTNEPTEAPSSAPTEVPTNEPTEPPTANPTVAPDYQKGDANMDGDINIKDATAIQKHIARLEELSIEGMILAEYDGDTQITIKDATAIQKFIAGIPV